VRTVHDEARQRTPEYEAWRAMRQRCLNPKHRAYKRYGARGITICARWSNYSAFLADMGRCPPGLTLERKDNALGYGPENCIWATRKAQQRNRRNTLKVEFEGQLRPLAEIAEERGKPYHLVWDRVFRSGWTVEKAVA